MVLITSIYGMQLYCYHYMVIFDFVIVFFTYPRKLNNLYQSLSSV